jgi:hypothetical protein
MWATSPRVNHRAMKLKTTPKTPKAKLDLERAPWGSSNNAKLDLDRLHWG